MYTNNTLLCMTQRTPTALCYVWHNVNQQHFVTYGTMWTNSTLLRMAQWTPKTLCYMWHNVHQQHFVTYGTMYTSAQEINFDSGSSCRRKEAKVSSWLHVTDILHFFLFLYHQSEYKLFYKLMCWLAGSLTCRLTSVMMSLPAERSRKFNRNWWMFGSSRWGFYITHSDAPQSVGFLWTGGKLVAETSTWHTTFTTDKHPCPRGIGTHDLSRRAAYALDRTATGTGTIWIYYVR
jgi:hypothetical protein